MCEQILSIGDVGIFEIGRWSRLGTKFASLYGLCFAEAPYFETYDSEWIKQNVYEAHIRDGCIVVALQGSDLVGAACSKSMALYKESSPYRYLAKQDTLPFNLDSSLFVTELAVLPHVRRRGIATALVLQTYEWGRVHRCTACVTRTAREGSNSVGIFRRLGSQELSGFQCVAQETDEVPSKSTERIYLWKEL